MKKFSDKINESIADKIKSAVEPIFQELFDIVPCTELTKYYWKNDDSYYTPQVGNNVIAYEMIFRIETNLELLSEFIQTLNSLSKVHEEQIIFLYRDLYKASGTVEGSAYDYAILELRIIYISKEVYVVTELDMFYSKLVEKLRSERSNVTLIELKQMIDYKMGADQIKINVKPILTFNLGNWYKVINDTELLFKKSNSFNIKTITPIGDDSYQTIYITTHKTLYNKHLLT